MSKYKGDRKGIKGRPKQNVEDRLTGKKFNLTVIKKLAMHGLIDEELADILDINRVTLTRWKRDPKFIAALKKGKLKADMSAEDSLYKRVIGYKYDEVTKELKSVVAANGTITQELIVTKIVTKEVPPEAVACFFWLKNRRKDNWKDKQEIEHSGEVSITVNGLPKV